MKIDTNKSEVQNLRNLVIDTYPNMSEDYRDYIEFRNMRIIPLSEWDIQTKKRYLLDLNLTNINDLGVAGYNTSIDIYIENKKYATLKYRRIALQLLENTGIHIRPYPGVINKTNDLGKVIRHVKRHYDFIESSVSGYSTSADKVTMTFKPDSLLYVGRVEFAYLSDYPVEHMGRLGWGRQ